MLETWVLIRVKPASQFKKSQIQPPSVVSHIQVVVGRHGWKWIERSVLQLLLLKQKEVELLLLLY